MKTIFTFLLSMLVSVALAQDPAFVHTATAGNISGDASFISHPDLDGNPNARLIVTHTWNPPGSAGVYNTHQTGVFYSAGLNQWSVYNESGAPMIVGSSYNIYIGQGSDTSLHIADVGNQGAIDSYTVLNHPDLNNNPNARLFIQTYYNPNSLRNDHPYGVWYDTNTNRWIIYSEDGATIPLDSAFFYTVNPLVAQTMTHRADAGNISGNYTELDHPLLNNNPNGVVLINHNWGLSGASSNVIMDHPVGVWYTGSRWAIFTEDLTAMPVDIEFDIMVYDPSLGVSDSAIEGLTYFPNPVQDVLDIRANTEIDSVTVFDILGREVMQQNGTINTMKLNMSGLHSGSYLARVQSGNKTQVIKLIKQ